MAEIVEQWQAQSNATCQQANPVLDVAYGPWPRQQLDIFPADAPSAPVQIFFHGGYWQAMDKSVFRFITNGFRDYGVTTVLVNYPLMPQASLDELIASCREAMVWLYQHINHYQGDPQKLYISGHSAGGHIVAMLMATEWPAHNDTLPNDLIKGGCAISGLFNLIPIQLSYLNDVLGLDVETANHNSPVQHEPSCHSPLIVTVGSLESVEYHAQSEELSAVWSNLGLPISQLRIAWADHFSILEHISQPKAKLNEMIRQQMGLVS